MKKLEFTKTNWQNPTKLHYITTHLSKADEN